MAPKIKVCGVRDVETMRACVEQGVDYVGLNFAPGS
ncbi:MAG: phosphoribosylanthranilate isomerase, partial [Flavobacteriales bacterium]